MMTQLRLPAFVLCLFICLALLTPAVSAADKSTYQTGFVGWRAAESGFAAWQRDGLSLAADGKLQFDPLTAHPDSDPYPAGGYNGQNYYNGGDFMVGEATSPVVSTGFTFTEAIASWNADTPAGTWIETQIRAQFGTRWTKWYILGIWAADYSTINRHSVRLQGDADGYVAVDTLVLTNKKETADAFQLKARLFSEDGSSIPSMRNVSLAYSTRPPKLGTVSTSDSGQLGPLNVPQCSQMVYPDGGEVWCSPTSTSMVLWYWNQGPGPCEPRVRDAVDGVYDWVYNGHGNWPFNTAYAATKGLEGYVARFTSLTQAEDWIAAGVPVVMSIAWKKGELSGSTIPSTNGHLLVLVGFDAAGNPIINDPAAASDAGVRVTYMRSEFEPLWLQASGGTVYLIYPPGWAVPSPQ